MTCGRKSQFLKEEVLSKILKTKLSEAKEKLDKLVSVYLDGDIECATYLERKDILLCQKVKLEESLTDFEQQRKN